MLTTTAIVSLKLHISCVSQLKSCYAKSGRTLGLIGQFSNGTLLLLGCVECSNAEDVQDIRNKLPGGINVCGLATPWDSAGESDHSADSLKQFDYILPEITAHDPVVIHYDSKSQQIRTEVISQSGDTTDIEYSTVSNRFLHNCILARASTYIPLNFTVGKKDSWKSSIHNEILSVYSDVSSTGTLYHLQSSSVLLGTDYSIGTQQGASCRDLADYIHVDSSDMGTRRKKTDKQRTVIFDVYTDLSNAGILHSLPHCAPIINYSTEKLTVASMQLPLDVVCVIDPSLPVDNLAKVFSEAFSRQLLAMEKCICSNSKGDSFALPVPYHFNPIDTEVLFTLVYPDKLVDSQLESHRREIHRSLCLAEDKPLFRIANKHVFPEDLESAGYLINVHQGLPPSKVSEGTQYIVKGRYSYHHYMQDRFDDNKWGCAYRSLQTLVSWFRLQGYTDKPVPDHRTIQQTLVDIGDKDPKFVGSKKWIGSMEVSFVLDTILDVTSKILSVSAGAELAGKGRELAAHFTSQGTPVMIGGGVLAHTILGVDYNEVTGDINFLILDPHYTGAEDLKVIQDKGWCGWKGPEFWDQHAHYNMCLPQRPSVI